MRKMGKRILIFTGGSLSDWAVEEIQDGDFLIGADRGAHFLIQHGKVPHVAVGDFDSVTEEEFGRIQRTSLETISCDALEKDLTDTELAFDLALSYDAEEIVIIGALGTRFDHSLANVHLLVKGLAKHVLCKIVDQKNEILLADRPMQIVKGKYSHVSLLPLTPQVTGITLEGFQYPLTNAVLTLGQSLGISNRLLDESGIVHLETGQLLIIKSRD
ncbi:thiamine diphosphokinase [Paenibacillus gansuensis]|uniref:Thiamine diphosphokinase n=1 Tax=Paenibacillus gansuensis TaxID=306542 RepID=A0ABW5PAR4_9BACL